MQVMGNIYFSYDWVTKKISENPNWLTNFKEMIEFFSFDISMKNAKMILALLVGVPIPLISVFLLKSVSDYIGTDTSEGFSITPSDAIQTSIDKKEKKDLSTQYFEELKEKEKKTV